MAIQLIRKNALIPAVTVLLGVLSLFWLGFSSPARAEQDPDPSAGVLIRVYKQAAGADPFYTREGSYLEEDGVMSNYRQGSLEVWAWSRSERRYKPYKTFPVEAYRGWLGPKTRAHDHQTPEGFYTISRLNPNSKYGGKGLWIDYPNRHDSGQSQAWTGSDLEIHGDHRSDGCLAMENQISEIYGLVERAMKGGQKEVPLHIFPFPMNDKNMDLVRDQKWYPFWKNLKQGSDAFEATHLPPQIGVDSASRNYTVQPVGEARPHDPLPPGKAVAPEPAAPPEASLEAAPHACGKILKAYFGDEANREKIKDYLRIQSQLTLHRVAWAYLKVQDGKPEGIQKTIERLLGERDPALHEKFVKGEAGPTAGKPSGNLALMNGIEALRAEAARRVPADDRTAPYHLKYGDLKMLNLLVETEKSFGSGRSGGVIDFVKMINSSYRGRLANKESNIRIAEKTVARLSGQMNAIAQDVQRYMAKNGCAQPMDAFACESSLGGNDDLSHFSDLLQESVDIQEGLFAVLNDRKEEIREANRWGSYWLHVAGRPEKSFRREAKDSPAKENAK